MGCGVKPENCTSGEAVRAEEAAFYCSPPEPFITQQTTTRRCFAWTSSRRRLPASSTAHAIIMSASGSTTRNPPVAARRSRAVSNLTPEQAKRKRVLDRKAQQALRERKEAHTRRLEDDLAQLRLASAEQERRLNLVMEENAQLRASLQRLGHYALQEAAGESAAAAASGSAAGVSPRTDPSPGT